MEKSVNSGDLKSPASACQFESDRGHQILKEYRMAHPHKNRPRKGRRKIGSKKRKARALKGKKRGKK